MERHVVQLDPACAGVRVPLVEEQLHGAPPDREGGALVPARRRAAASAADEGFVPDEPVGLAAVPYIGYVLAAEQRPGRDRGPGDRGDCGFFEWDGGDDESEDA